MSGRDGKPQAAVVLPMPMRPALALPLLLAMTEPAPAVDAEKLVIGNNPIQKLIQTGQPVFFGLSPSGLPPWDPAAADPPLSADEHIRNGVTLTPEQCAELTSAVWLRVRERDFCIRYWLSTAGGREEEALVFLHGDVGGLIDGKLRLVDAARAITAASAQRNADASSRTYRGPYIAIGRPGALGSSGHHVNDRRTWLEFQVIDAALDAIKARHGFSRLHLVGHSGGGHTVAALARRRDDIGCAVMASAALSVATWHRLKGQSYSQAVRPLYDPIDHVGLMQPRPGLRLIVLSDPDDKAVPFAAQREYVERVQARGLAILHITATAPDELSHNLAAPAIRLATDCAGGVDDHTLLARYWTKPVAALVAAKPANDRPATASCNSLSLIGSRLLSNCTPEWPPAAASVRGDRLPIAASRAPNIAERGDRADRKIAIEIPPPAVRAPAAEPPAPPASARAPRAETPLHGTGTLEAGLRADEAQCKALASALWLGIGDKNFCVRYWVGWPDKALPAEALAVFYGDIGRRREGKIELHEAAARLTDAAVQRHVEAVARRAGGVAFVVGRPGTFGSSGSHLRDRRTLTEVRVMAAALDALKARYGVSRFHLTGQSGGGHTVAALAQMRGDLGCAVIASGSLSLITMQRDAGLPMVGEHSLYNPLDHVPGMRRRPDLRLIVVSDPDDKVVSFRSQREFVERVRVRGLPILHITATAARADKNSHDLHVVALRVAAACAKGADDAALVTRFQDKTVETSAAPVRRDHPQPPAPASPASRRN